MSNVNFSDYTIEENPDPEKILPQIRNGKSSH